MADWCSNALLKQGICEPCDAVGVLGVDHHHCAMGARQRQQFDDLPVVELEGVVSHIDLERRVAFFDQLRQLFMEHVRCRIGDDQMKRVVDDRAAIGAPVVELDRRAQALAFLLAREGDDGRGAATGCRDRAAREVVSHHAVVASVLVKMAVAVHAAGRYQPASRIDLVCAACKSASECDDAPIAYTNVGDEAVGRRGDIRVADYQVEGARIAHATSRNRLPQPFTRNVSIPLIRNAFQTTVEMVSYTGMPSSASSSSASGAPRRFVQKMVIASGLLLATSRAILRIVSVVTSENEKLSCLFK